MVSVHAEPTFERLRYLLGGDRPSQTAHLTMSPDRFHGRRLEFQYHKSGIQRTAPQKLTLLLPRLPPILYIQYQNPILGYSKAPWGLSVLSRVTGIFTGTTISPGGLSRQRPGRYTIRAGQNLPDKEFRYLRTVIVTAAVYRGFGSKLSLIPLTFRHRAGVSPYTSSFDLAETCVFDKQSPGPFLCGLHVLHGRHPLSLSYGVKLPSSLTTLLPLALESSSYLPVSVCGTGASYIPRDFSRLSSGMLPYCNFRSLAPGSTIARVMLSKSVITLKYFGGYGMSTVCASTTPFGLALAPG